MFILKIEVLKRLGKVAPCRDREGDSILVR